MVRARNMLLTKDRMATNREIEDLEAIENRKIERPHYIQEPIANIQGIEVHYQENNLRDLIVCDLEQGINALAGSDIDQMNFSELRKWSKWVNSFGVKFEKARAIVAAGRRFFIESNLLPFRTIIEDPDDAKQFQKLIAALPI